MSKRTRGKSKLFAHPKPVSAPTAAPLSPQATPTRSPFVITIAYDPQSEVVNYNTVRQGDGVVYVDDQIKALRTTYEMFVGRLAIEIAKAEQVQAPQTEKG